MLNGKSYCYYPYADNNILIKVFSALIVLYSILLAIALVCFDISVIVLLGSIFVILIIALKKAYVLSKMKIMFEEKRLVVLDIKGHMVHSIPYSEMPYAFYGKGYKMRGCLIISSDILERKQIRKLAIKGTFFEKLIVDGYIVIPMNELVKTPEADPKKLVEVVCLKVLNTEHVEELLA